MNRLDVSRKPSIIKNTVNNNNVTNIFSGGDVLRYSWYDQYTTGGTEKPLHGGVPVRDAAIVTPVPSTEVNVGLSSVEEIAPHSIMKDSYIDEAYCRIASAAIQGFTPVFPAGLAVALWGVRYGVNAPVAGMKARVLLGLLYFKIKEPAQFPSVNVGGSSNLNTGLMDIDNEDGYYNLNGFDNFTSGTNRIEMKKGEWLGCSFMPSLNVGGFATVQIPDTADLFRIQVDGSDIVGDAGIYAFKNMQIVLPIKEIIEP